MNDQGRQKRTPSGVPSGGEFAANEHDEATLPLEGQQEKRSFLYPPYLNSAQQVIDYYEDIEIDDATVSKFIDAYGAARAVWAEDHMDAFDIQNRAKNGHDKEKHDAARRAEFRRMESLHPVYANPIFARDLTRAIQMTRIAEWSLSGSEKEKLMEYELTLPNGVKQPISSIAERYLVGQYEADLI